MVEQVFIRLLLLRKCNTANNWETHQQEDPSGPAETDWYPPDHQSSIGKKSLQSHILLLTWGAFSNYALPSKRFTFTSSLLLDHFGIAFIFFSLDWGKKTSHYILIVVIGLINQKSRPGLVSVNQWEILVSSWSLTTTIQMLRVRDGNNKMLWQTITDRLRAKHPNTAPWNRPLGVISTRFECRKRGQRWSVVPDQNIL